MESEDEGDAFMDLSNMKETRDLEVYANTSPTRDRGELVGRVSCGRRRWVGSWVELWRLLWTTSSGGWRWRESCPPSESISDKTTG